MASLDPAVAKAIEDALDALFRVEKLLSKIDARGALSTVTALKQALELNLLEDALGSIAQTELDMRMARLRIKAMTGLEPPSMTSDPDRPTPVEPVQRRSSSSQTMRGFPAPTVVIKKDPK